MEIVTLILENWQQYLGVLSALLVGVIAVCTLIPGPEPEATLQRIVDFIASISRK
jgi:hypothetical protein